jgi:hypothetical protein
VSGRTLLLGAVVAGVVFALGAALWVLDSPAEERRRRLDEERSTDLHRTADAVDGYWTRKGKLPADLAAVAEWRGLDGPPADPVTEEPYEYRVTGADTYELCATFAAESPGREIRWAREEHAVFWRHPAGRHCFELEAREVGD